MRWHPETKSKVRPKKKYARVEVRFYIVLRILDWSSCFWSISWSIFRTIFWSISWWIFRIIFWSISWSISWLIFRTIFWSIFYSVFCATACSMWNGGDGNTNFYYPGRKGSLSNSVFPSVSQPYTKISGREQWFWVRFKEAMYRLCAWL